MATQLRPSPPTDPAPPVGARLRAWALRALVTGGVVGLLLVVRPEIVRGTFSSAESMLRVGAVVVAWVVFSLVLRRLVANQWLRLGIVSVAGAGLLWLTVAPYFVDETVDDAFPVAVGAPDGGEPTAPAVTSTVAAPPQAAAVEAAAPTTPAPTTVVPTTVAPTVPAAPVKVSTGQFVGLDGHQGRGEAAIYRQPDGSLFVRLQDFEVSNGPGLTLYLVPGAGADRPDGGLNLGPMRGNRGNQNFGIPAGTAVDGPHTILVWCQPFAVPVAGATQTAS